MYEFEYRRAGTIEEAVAALEADEDAVLLAGGDHGLLRNGLGETCVCVCVCEGGREILAAVRHATCSASRGHRGYTCWPIRLQLP